MAKWGKIKGSRVSPGKALSNITYTIKFMQAVLKDRKKKLYLINDNQLDPVQFLMYFSGKFNPFLKSR